MVVKPPFVDRLSHTKWRQIRAFVVLCLGVTVRGGNQPVPHWDLASLRPASLPSGLDGLDRSLVTIAMSRLEDAHCPDEGRRCRPRQSIGPEAGAKRSRYLGRLVKAERPGL
ncbi:hypothetical protein NL676_016769 [Syzygium grande]|nr:hypothetical protein NL676_016769 [Syzygium grande]